ncbi:hypothetical protein ACCO45_005383 [Purpureocillium lilacinum]|uniref:Uncharacterized protein n=1 Tax=Purpureocillium lilacinum TaxID=33203 RepID=A0ACC4DXW8_PURLI
MSRVSLPCHGGPGASSHEKLSQIALGRHRPRRHTPAYLARHGFLDLRNATIRMVQLSTALDGTWSDTLNFSPPRTTRRPRASHLACLVRHPPPNSRQSVPGRLPSTPSTPASPAGPHVGGGLTLQDSHRNPLTPPAAPRNCCRINRFHEPTMSVGAQLLSRGPAQARRCPRRGVEEP